MNNTFQTISLIHLLTAFSPFAVILGILFKWSFNAGAAFFPLPWGW